METRRAGPDDVDELIRLRQVMFDALTESHDTTAGWEPVAAEVLRAGIVDGSLVGVVVDGPDGGLVAGGVGTVAQRLPGPGNHSGRVGFVQSMATDPEWRRQGLARRVFAALLDWFDGEGITAVDLHASPDGEALYRSFGFREGPNVELSRRAGAGTP